MIPKRLLDEIERWIKDKKYGNIQINFAGGKILNINRVESIKIDVLVVTNPATHFDCTASRPMSIAE